MESLIKITFGVVGKCQHNVDYLVKDVYLNITALMYTQTKLVVLKLYGTVCHTDKIKKGSSQTDFSVLGFI